MKYIVMLGDGMADEPLAELGGKTPLEVAKTETMDALAKKSEMGMAHTIPEGMSPGSDTANLAVLGYNPRIYYTGRSPLEALSIGVDMKDTRSDSDCTVVKLDMPRRTNDVSIDEILDSMEPGNHQPPTPLH